MDCAQHSSTTQLGVQWWKQVFLHMQLAGRSPTDSFEEARLGVSALPGTRAHPSV